MSTRELGSAGEKLARQYLTRRGLRIIETNYRSPLGEVDIICRDRDTVVFVEVKARTGTDYGAPVEAVGFRKQTRLRRLAEQYLMARRLEHAPVRFDVLGIVFGPDAPDVEYIPGAF
jgi:putative endonuclease